MDKESLPTNIMDFLLHEHFDAIDIDKGHLDKYDSLEVSQSIVTQFLSFYKLTFVESGVKDINVITSSILSSFMILVNEYAKNVDGVETKRESIQKVIDCLSHSKSIILQNRNNFVNYENK